MVEFTTYQAEMVQFFMVMIIIITIGTALLAAGSSKAATIVKKIKSKIQ